MNNLNKEQFIGKIIYRQKKKVYHRASPYFKQIYYKLLVKSDSFITNQQKLFVYANKLSNIIWNVVENKTYFDKKYRFTVQKSKWGWILLDWEEINSKTII